MEFESTDKWSEDLSFWFVVCCALWFGGVKMRRRIDWKDDTCNLVIYSLVILTIVIDVGYMRLGSNLWQ